MLFWGFESVHSVVPYKKKESLRERASLFPAISRGKRKSVLRWVNTYYILYSLCIWVEVAVRKKNSRDVL